MVHSCRDRGASVADRHSLSLVGQEGGVFFAIRNSGSELEAAMVVLNATRSSDTHLELILHSHTVMHSPPRPFFLG